MVLSKAIALAIAGAIGCAALPVVAQNPGVPIFIPPNARDKDDRHGEHYDTVVANYTRRCTSLDGQFSRLRAHIGDSAALREAAALHEQGVTHCNGGDRLQGIDELSAAIRAIGGIPRVEL